MEQFNKADIHIHTNCSDGLMSSEILVDYVARKTDLRVIAVTDHDNVEGGLRAKAYRDNHLDEYGHVDVIVGSEVTSTEGEILALFITEDIPKGLSALETVERIHAQGGLAIAAHPFSFVITLLRIPGMRGARRLIRTLPFDGVETRNATPTEFLSNPLTAWYNQRGSQHAPTGGSDTHYLPTVGSTYTLFHGETASDLRYAIENKQTSAGGHVYNPLLIFNVLWGAALRRLQDMGYAQTPSPDSSLIPKIPKS